jgi:thiosulfate dehydrogenase (quinone) large subunit
MTSRFGLNSWRAQPLYMTLIRLWLGVTWTYGGWAKATDGGYLDQASTNYFGAQISPLIGHSPISFLLKPMLEHATLFAWFVMISEFAIGIAVLAGVALQAATLGGFSVSLILWLSVTYHVHPYFLGSDLPYAVMWAALFLMVRNSNNGRGRHDGGLIPNLRDRREVMRIAGVAIASVIAAFAGGSFRPKKSAVSAIIAKTADVKIGDVKPFTAMDGSAAYLFRTKAGVFAYSRICTHQGCNVNYDALGNQLACPCHGARFDPTNNGAVLAGPAVTPLPKIKVAISGENIVQI